MKIKKIKFSTLILILTVLIVSSCDKVAVIESVYGVDNNNVIAIIEEKGEYKLKSGYTFDKYKKSEHFELYYNGSIKKNDEIANERLIELENEYERILRFFDMNKSDMPIIKIYMFHNDNDIFHKSLELELGDRYDYLSGRYVKSNSIFTLNQSSIVYDFSECVILNYAKDKEIPAWLSKGTLSYLNFSEDPYKNYYANYSELDSLDFDKISNESIMSYEYGYSLVKCIVEQYGEDILKKLIASYGNIEKVLGITYDELFEKWQQYVKNNCPDNVYGHDETDIIEIIDKSGYYEDECGYKFDAYLKNKHFEIYYNSKSYNSKIRAENTINYLEENYERILNLFKVKEADMPVVKINMYTEYSGFVNIARKYNLAVEVGFLGLSTRCNRFYISYHQDKAQYEMLEGKTVALHEFIHSVHKNKTSKKYIEKWFLEGLAMYYSQKLDEIGQNYHSKFIEEGLPINDDSTSINYLNNYENAYIYGYSMVEYVLKQYDIDIMDSLINAYGDIEKALGISYKTFSDEWRIFIRNKR